MTPLIKLLSLDLELVALIDDYESFYYEEKYADIGECSMKISVYSQNFKFLQKNMILYISEYECWYIEEININDDIATITALTLNFILGHRITIPPKGETHLSYTKTLTSNVALSLINSSLVNSIIKERNINLKLPTSSTLGHSVDYNSRFRNLLEEVQALCNYSALGFAIGLDLKNRNFIFKLYNGRDLSQDIIFSEDFDNVINMKLVDSNLSYKNHIYVAGQGQGIDRTVIEAYENDIKSSWFRREEIKDARDKEKTEELYLEGDKILLENCEKTSIEAEISYVDDIAVGDIVTIITKKYGYKFTQRILQKDVEYTVENGKSINIIIGSQKPTLSFGKESSIIE